MAYHGYIPFIKDFLDCYFGPTSEPKILEVGVQHGQSYFPLLSYLAQKYQKFDLVGCDVLFRDEFNIIHAHLGMELGDLQNSSVVQASSLDLLPCLVDHRVKIADTFDIILLDGDHNYHTAWSDVENATKLLLPGGFILIDDYTGRYAETDMFYSDREEYAEIDTALKRDSVQPAKEGVKTAVDDFVRENPRWKISKGLEAPALLYDATDKLLEYRMKTIIPVRPGAIAGRPG